MKQDRVACRHSLWFFILTFLGVAWAGSFWALLESGGAACSSCQEAKEFAGGPGLALLGTIAYSCLLAMGLFLGPTRLFLLGTSLAGGIHLVLMILLVHRGVFCPPCFLTGGAAITAMLLSLRLRLPHAMHAGVALSVAAVVTTLSFRLDAPDEQRTPSVILDPSVPPQSHSTLSRTPGIVQVLAFVRDGCHYCDLLEDDLFPVIKEEFGDTVSIKTKPAPDGIPTPTIVIDGANRTVFPGLPPLDRLRKAILDAQGGRP